jgi:hypothetical protein
VTSEFSSLGWFLVGVIGLTVLQRRLHYEIQAVLYLLTKRVDLVLTIFAILFLPGVLIHELSHYLMARLLNVPVGRLSLVPQPMANGRLRLGYVETGSTDFFRDALIGAAPLITGSIFVAYAGLVHLEFSSFWVQLSTGDFSSISAAGSTFVNQADFWIWFYLIFVISSTMFPSATDRRAWSPILLTVGVVVALVLIAGAGPWLWENFGATLLGFVHLLSQIFIISAIAHLFLLPFFWLMRIGLSRVFQVRVV